MDGDEKSGNKSQQAPANPEGSLPSGVKRVRWDSKNMNSFFSNVVNAQMTREEFHLFFGTNQTWNAQDSEELVVDLAARIVLTPHGAKRLQILLQGRIDEYERTNGKIAI